MNFFKELFCAHYWTNNALEVPNPKFKVSRIGLKDWRIDASWFGCKFCGKVKRFCFAFIPINYEDKSK